MKTTDADDGSQSRRRNAPRIGERLIRNGLITPEQAGEAGRLSVEKGYLFGEAAVVLGFISTKDVEDILAVGLSGQRVNDDTEVSKLLASFYEPSSAVANDFRSLRDALALRWFLNQSGGRALSIVSTSRRDGRSICAANLAISLSQAGLRTLLIDGDVHNPRQHQLFGLDNRLGLCGYLAVRMDEAGHYRVNGAPDLTVMPVGPLPQNSHELLLRPTLDALLVTSIEKFEAVVVDTPAAAVSNDYRILARATGGVLMLARSGSTRSREAAQIIKYLKELDVTIVGGSFIEG